MERKRENGKKEMKWASLGFIRPRLRENYKIVLGPLMMVKRVFLHVGS